MKQEGLDTILRDRENDSSQLIEVLLDIQEKFRYLPENMLREVSARMKVPLMEVYRVANFYKAFSLNQRGTHLLTVCNGTACHVKGSPKLIDEAKRLLDLNPGETSADGEFTLETVNCVGACALSPVAILDGQYYEHVTPSKLKAILESARKKQEGEKA